MSLDKLDYVLALAEERNLTRAARKAFISQPALTNYINRLEEQLGVKLFDRSVTPIEITRAGALFERTLPGGQERIAFCTLQQPVYTRTSVAAYRPENPRAALCREAIALTRELVLPRLELPV